MTYRTDRNNNPTAFTTAVAIAGGLKEGQDFVQGDSFTAPDTHILYYTAKLIGDPIALTIGVIDKVGFRVGSDPFKPRWTYINLPYDLWQSLTTAQKRLTIGEMYKVEGGVALKALFAVPSVP